MRVLFALPVLLLSTAATIGCNPPESTGDPADSTSTSTGAQALEPFVLSFDGAFQEAKIASGPDNEICVGGTSSVPFDLGGGELEAPSPGTLFIAHLDPQGGHIMSRSTGAYEEIGDVAKGSDGACFMVGSFEGVVDFGGGALTAKHAGFATRFNGDGSSEFSRAFPQKSTMGILTQVDSVAALPEGGAVIAASTDDSVNFGQNDIPPSPTGVANTVVAVYRQLGTFQWQLRYSSNQASVPRVATDKDGDIYLVGSTNSEFTLGADVIPAFSIYVAKLTPSGERLWVKWSQKEVPEMSAAPTVEDISVDAEGSVYIVGGYYNDPFSIAGVTVAGSPYVSAYLIKLDKSGDGIYANAFPFDSGSNPMYVAGAANGEALFGMEALGLADFGAGQLGTEHNRTAFLTRFDAKGAPLKSAAIGGPTDDYMDDLAVDGEGNPLLTGRFETALDIAGKHLTNNGNRTSYLARIQF